MTRQEFRQAALQTTKHDLKGWLALAAIVVAYCIVGALEHI